MQGFPLTKDNFEIKKGLEFEDEEEMEVILKTS